MPDPNTKKVIQEILQYLKTHPDASDDLNGIAHFWVCRQRIDAAVATVERALEALVEEGLLKKKVVRAQNGQTPGTTYQLNK